MTKIEDQDQPEAGMPLPPIEPLLTIKQVEDLLKLGNTALYTMMRSGALPYIKIGNTRRVHPETIRQLYRTGAASAPGQKGWKGLRVPKVAEATA